MEDGDEDDGADAADELACRFADGHGQSDSVAAAEDDDEEEAAKANKGPADGFVVLRVDGGDPEVGGNTGGALEIASIEEEDESGSDKQEHDAEEGDPDDAASAAPQEEHDDEGHDEGDSRCGQKPVPVVFDIVDEVSQGSLVECTREGGADCAEDGCEHVGVGNAGSAQH